MFDKYLQDYRPQEGAKRVVKVMLKHFEFLMSASADLNLSLLSSLSCIPIHATPNSSLVALNPTVIKQLYTMMEQIKMTRKMGDRDIVSALNPFTSPVLKGSWYAHQILFMLCCFKIVQITKSAIWITLQKLVCSS